MPIQFVCNHCRKLLSVGSRKIGSTVACPKCARPLVVPTPEVAQAGVAMRESLKAAQSAEPAIPEFIVYDEEVSDVALAPRQPEEPIVIDIETGPSLRNAPPATLSSRAAARPASRPGSPAAPERAVSPSLAGRGRTSAAAGQLLLVSRRTLFVQAALFGIVAIVCLSIGFLMGRGTMPDVGTVAADAAQDVIVQGNITYQVGDASARPDAGAVIMALPDAKVPNPKLPIEGLSPQSPAPPPGSQALLAIEDLGGAYVRAKQDGSYLLTVPRPGKYIVFFISRQADRPEGNKPDEFDLAVMGRYFEGAEKLVGQHKYRWRNETIEGVQVSKSHDFGKSGEL